MQALWAALCLVAVLEGLLLFIAPGAWKRMAEQLQQLEDQHLRRIGALIMAIGLLLLYIVRR